MCPMCRAGCQNEWGYLSFLSLMGFGMLTYILKKKQNKPFVFLVIKSQKRFDTF